MTSTPPPPPAAPLPMPGDLIAGKYRTETLLGKGGMGAVYAAQHEILFQKVAIKVLLSAGVPEAVARFLNEARAAARIQSEHVVRVLDVGTENGTPYMVMEHLDGQDLGKLLAQRGPLPPQEVVDCVVEALEAVAQAHAMQIIHRDLKPANLFLCRRQDGRSFVKVLDFGISKAASPLGPSSGGMTSTKALLGSPFYMSPEQLRSSRSVDARTDIWSIGVIMYELMTGVVPFTGENLGELFAAILEQPAPPLRAYRPHVPAELEQIVLRCLQRDPGQRFSSARELAAALSRFASPRGMLAADRIHASRMAAPALMPAASSVNPHAASVYGAVPRVAPPAGASPVPAASLARRTDPLPPAGLTPDPLPPPGFTPQGLPPLGLAGPGQGAGGKTSSAWGNTGDRASGASRKPLFIVLAVVAGTFVLGAGSFAVYKMRGQATPQIAQSATSAAIEPPAPPLPAANTAPAVVTAIAPAPAVDTSVAAFDSGAPAVATPSARASRSGRPRSTTLPSVSPAPTATQNPPVPSSPVVVPPASTSGTGKDVVPGAGRK